MNYASWGARVGGAILNGLIGVLFGLPGNIAQVVLPTEYEECTVRGESGICEVPTSQSLAIIILLAAIGVVAYYVLYSKAVGKTGQFWGHKGAGVRIVDADTGAPIGTGKAFGRSLLHIVDILPCGLGFLWPLWDKKKQTFADKIVGTVSIRA